MLTRLRALVFVFFGLLYVASLPGAKLRPSMVELAAPPIPKEISGRDGLLDVVVRAREGDKKVVSGAVVRAFAILDDRAHFAGEARSDEDGRATLRDLPRAEHWIVAEAPGRERASRMVAIVSGARRLDLELGFEHTIDVEVNDEQNAPMIGAELEVRGADPFPVGARTGEDGHVRVGRLGEGPFTVVARAPGFDEVTKRHVPEGELVSIVLGKRGGLAVEVVDEDGAPLPASRVLTSSSVLGSLRVTETGKNGTVHIAGLEQGSYAIRAINGTRVSPIELGIVIGKGEEKSVRLTLGPGVMISAHVVDGATDEDVRDARVTLAEGGLSPFPIEAVTDKHGRAVLGPIPRGPATLSARADDFVPKAALPIEDPPQGEVKVPLSRGGVLVGKITDARGYSVDGATIRVVGTDVEGMPIDEDPSHWSFREAHFAAQLRAPSALLPAGDLGVMPGPVPPIPHGPSIGLAFGVPPSFAGGTPSAISSAWVTGRDGIFRASPVTPGRVRAVVRHPQYVEAMSEIVLLESNKEAHVDVVLQRGGTLEGRVVDARGRAIGGAFVSALATRGSLELTSRSGSDGSFAFASLPDAVTLLVSRDDDPTAIAARLDVTVPEAGKRSIEIVLPEPRPPLPVKVTDRRGNALESAQVSAVSLDPREALRVTAFSDAHGQAALVGARGLPVRIEVHAPGHAGRVFVTEIDTAELVAELSPAESVTGEVTTRRRDPIANAEVTLRTEVGLRHVRTNKDGIFTIDEISPGPAHLRVRAAGVAPAERSITIEERGGRRPTEIARFELVEEAVVEGTVVDERGDPIAGARVAKDSVPTYLPVGGTALGIAITDGRGRFRLGGLAEGTISLEAYVADVGRTRRTDVRAVSGRTIDGLKLVIRRDETGPKEPTATGGVAITLGETSPGPDGPEVVVITVSEGSEAERGGLRVGDVLLEVGGTRVASITEARARLSGAVHDDVLVKVRRGEKAVSLRVSREPVRR